MEAARRWGNRCSCPEHAALQSVDCAWSSRRLQYARRYIDEFCARINTVRSDATMASCGAGPAYMEFTAACGLLMARVKLKFAWLSDVPYLFAEADSPCVAQLILGKWEGPAQRRETLWMKKNFEADIVRVAGGGQPSQALMAEILIYRTFPLSELVAEGMRRDIQVACDRGHSVKAPYAFAELRFKANMARVKEALRLEDGARNVCVAWKSFKAVTRATGRAPGLGVKAFQHERIPLTSWV